MNDPVESEPYLGPERLLLELSLPFPQDIHGQLAMQAAKTLDPVQRLTRKAGGSFAAGQQPTAMFHLYARSITDLVTAIHLLSHCYVQQAHSAIRPVQENCDLLDLFAADPAEARLWMDPATPWSDFIPREVRKKLGHKKPDEMYGHLSEIGPHPRFAGMRVAGGMLRNAAGDTKAVLRIGPLWPEHPATIDSFFLVAHHALHLGFRAQHLTLITARVTMFEWLRGYRDTIEAAATLSKEIRKALVEIGDGEGTEFLDSAYDEGLEKIDKILAEEALLQPPAEQM